MVTLSSAVWRKIKNANKTHKVLKTPRHTKDVTFFFHALGFLFSFLILRLLFFWSAIPGERSIDRAYMKNGCMAIALHLKTLIRHWSTLCGEMQTIASLSIRILHRVRLPISRALLVCWRTLYANFISNLNVGIWMQRSILRSNWRLNEFEWQ